MKKQFIIFALLLILIFAVGGCKKKVADSDSKKDTSKTELQVQDDEESEDVQLDEGVLSVEDESKNEDENESVNETTVGQQGSTVGDKESTTDKEDSQDSTSKEDSENNTEEKNENLYNLDKDGDGFVDGWY